MSSDLVQIAETAARHARDEFQSRSRTLAETGPASEALDDSLIAELPDDVIARMTRDELVRVIRAADLPLPTGYDADRLRLQSQRTLARLAFLARLACRNRVTILGRCYGIDEP
jgi:hypothetical protein